jgi:hypothetical protein
MRRTRRRRKNEGVAGSEPSRPMGSKYMVCGCQSFDARCGRKLDYLDVNVTYIIRERLAFHHLVMAIHRTKNQL